jgi:hypothetical protein
MWNYIIGPILALLPKPWRKALPILSRLPWGRATAVSGLGESLAAIVALADWYMYAMTTWVDTAVSRALDGKLGPNVTVQEIGAVALAVWWTHPLTLLLGYFILEGMLRFCAAAFSEQSFGIFPLGMLDWIFIRPFRRQNPANVTAEASMASNARSLVGAVSERILTARGAQETDELHFLNEGNEEFVEIRASHRKQDWDPPRVVRFEDAYYRLEAAATKLGPRPFSYMLRKLPAGVPGRNVLIYSPVDVPVPK